MIKADMDSFEVPLFFARSGRSTGSNRTGDWSFIQPSYGDRTAPCSEHCPCGTDIPKVEALAAEGKPAAAWASILMENPLPGVCGRVCYHPCEQACNRGEFDAPVAIHALERFLADQARPERAELRPGGANGKRVAIIGSGPAGLSAASFLARLGYACDLFEADAEPGGVLRWGIPAYRLPGAVLAREIAAIQALGVNLHCGATMDTSLAGRFDALLVACGHGQAMGLGVPGAELARDGLALLRAVRSQGAGGPAKAGDRVAVIGGGNTAIDVARTLLRQGQRPIIVYRRRREDMPAFAPELERALAEGAQLLELSAPIALSRAESGFRLTLQKMRSLDAGADGRSPVAPLSVPPAPLLVAEVYSAVGAGPSPAWLKLMADTPRLRLARSSLAFLPTPVAFAGDLETETKSVSEAIASGKEAALALDICFRQGREAVVARLDACRIGGGSALSMELYLGGDRARRSPRVVRFPELNTAYFQRSLRARPRVLSARASIGSFAEVEAGLEPAEAGREAGRCFSCGTCNDCDNCRTFCPDIAVRVEGGARRIATEFCKGCGVCVEECPRSAMAMDMEDARS
jgi:NADPH-dependent glutamate synthase beta subunit-like oxidoreductase/Pyruvate/2-oxoacid:ferredoxin oxidoreductase delta subunit